MVGKKEEKANQKEYQRKVRGRTRRTTGAAEHVGDPRNERHGSSETRPRGKKTLKTKRISPERTMRLGRYERQGPSSPGKGDDPGETLPAQKKKKETKRQSTCGGVEHGGKRSDLSEKKKNKEDRKR